jgi:hypothetical protein
MPSTHADPAALGFTVIAVSVALEETLKALPEKNGNQPGQWLDEVQDIALLRASKNPEAASGRPVTNAS